MDKKGTKKIQLSMMNPGTPLAKPLPGYTGRQAVMEFHISREARKKYAFDDALFSLSGNVILAHFHSSRLFAQRMNEKKDLIKYPEQAVRAGHLNAMGLIDEILHYVIESYRAHQDPQATKDALDHLDASLGKKETDKILLEFSQQFPPLSVHQGKSSPKEYLQGESEGISHRELALEEMILLWTANKNPAFAPFRELFDDTKLAAAVPYTKAVDSLKQFFDSKPAFGPDNLNLMDMLRDPAIKHPESLSAQLNYMRSRWGVLLGKYLLRLLQSLDFVKEEEKMSFMGPGPSQVLEYEGDGYEDEPENFSPDKDWMPKVVMLAKSTLVWLDQMSKKYNRPIRRLDEIPDQELDTLAAQGFNALWLIGLWERSRASQRIKNLCGNPEAEASAYSLNDYDIAESLGGWEALQQLRDRCRRRGIRLASDMVPNHTGLDSNWVINHPDRFLQLDHPPFPTYTYNGENLSGDDRVGVYLEDHYYEKTDAAVTFKRVDHHTGATKYIYHGNDGTHMPWNDTAQINFLNPEAREAVIQKILHVAHNFPIIRFDAAMTLAKKHIQRLWFPEPGSGGDIASRAEYGMTKQDFDKAIPVEFWREVVDRVATEIPDTLLLAEAFWMMEGYFVRTLGMHRVYNSAFMNMMKKEENEKYRYTIKNTQEFDPEILKRFVNFMNNPDEETAVAQFGKADKYFGVSTMMVTMPGLPMFGHGQIEGYAEKYGMEYSRAYWNEQPDSELIRNHERLIFPLMKKRYLFAEVQDFLLYDLWTPEGQVNENVFAFSNRSGHEQALVFYNNAYESARGWIKTSAAFAQKHSNGEKTLEQRNLAEAMGLTCQADYFTLMYEHVSGLWFIRSSKEIHESGFFVGLNGYETQVFLDIQEVKDNDLGHYAALHHELQGAGVPSIDEALKMRLLQPLYNNLEKVFNPKLFENMRKLIIEGEAEPEQLFDSLEAELTVALKKVLAFIDGPGSAEKTAERIRRDMEALPELFGVGQLFAKSRTKSVKETTAALSKKLGKTEEALLLFTTWALLRNLGLLLSEKDVPLYSRSCMDEWLLTSRVRDLLKETDLSGEACQRALETLPLMVRHQKWAENKGKKKETVSDKGQKLFKDNEFRRQIGENRYNKILWFNKECFEDRLWWLLATGMADILGSTQETRSRTTKVSALIAHYEALLKAGELSEFQVEKLLSQLKKGTSTSAKKTPEKKTPKKRTPSKK